MPSRLVLLAAIFAVGCKRSNPDSSASAATLRFLPPSADLAFRIDVTRARTWSGWQKASDAAFRSMAAPIAAVKSACGLDVVREASSVIFAMHEDDVTLLITGLPKDKTTACPAKVGAVIPQVTFVPDGELFGISEGGKPFASGAVLPGGELVIVSRKGEGIEPGAWRIEVGGTGNIPAWWTELDQTQPLAIRVQSKDRTVTGSAELGDPLILRAKDISATPELAATDAARAKAIVEFLTKAGAGTGRIEPKGTTLFADFTATGPEIDKLIAAGVSTLGPSDQRMPEPPTGMDTSPIECSTLAAAVATYMTSNLEVMPADQRAQAQPMFDKLVPALQKAYVDSCTTGAWPPAAIHCHVDSAKNLPRFEKCRLVLSAEQRTKFDEAVKAVLSAP
jgi:hypothetical protein